MPALIAALLLTVTTALAAQERAADPLNSAECRAARAELESALDEPPSAGRSQRLAPARRQAAQACLGRTAERGERSGAPDPVRVVPPPVISAAPAARVPPAAAPTGPVAIPRPATITTCDPAGCWDSEGRRLNQVGPVLMGPRGLCTVQGGVVTCP